MTTAASNLPQIATDATWTTGPEIGQPTRLALTAAQLKQGLIAGNSYPASGVNAMLGQLSDWNYVHSHGALQRWIRTPMAATMTPSQLVGVLPVRSFDTSGDRGRMPLILGRDTSLAKLYVSISNDGSVFETPRTVGGSTIPAPVAASRGAAGELLYCDNSSATVFYSTNHSISFSSQSFGSNNKCAVHYAPGSSTPYLVLDNQGRISNASTIAGLTASTALVGVTTLAAPVAEFADDGGLNVVLVARPNTSTVYVVYHSGDGGATWASALTLGGGSANITYSKALKAFVCWDSSGTIQVSATGTVWFVTSTTATTANGLLLGYKTLATIGIVVVKSWINALSSGALFQRGIAYSFDLGSTWNTWAFGDTGTTGISQIHNINNRLVAFDANAVYTSGQAACADFEF